MLLTAAFAFSQLRKLDINEHPMSLLDDVLLFICLPAFFLETVLSMIATIEILNIIKSIDVIVMASTVSIRFVVVTLTHSLVCSDRATIATYKDVSLLTLEYYT